MKNLIAYRHTALTIVAIVAILACTFAQPANRAPHTAPALAYVALLALLAIVMFFIERTLARREYASATAWTARQYFVTMATYAACDYANALALGYTKRDARAHTRAYLSARYPGITASERNQVLRAGIEQSINVETVFGTTARQP